MIHFFDNTLGELWMSLLWRRAKIFGPFINFYTLLLTKWKHFHQDVIFLHASYIHLKRNNTFQILNSFQIHVKLLICSSDIGILVFPLKVAVFLCSSVTLKY